MEFKFTLDLLPQALPILLQGMAGIFIVLGIIYGACVGLQKLFPEDDQTK